MIVSKKKRFICVTIPKCASSSLRNMLYHSDSEVLLGRNHQRAVEEKMKYPTLAGFCVDQKKRDCESLKNFKSYYKFTFVRNPYARLVSCWKNKVLISSAEKKYTHFHAQYWAEKFSKFNQCSFPEFIEYITSSEDTLQEDNHWAPFYHIIPLWKMDFIGKVESFKDDARYMLSTLNIETKHKHVLLEPRNPSSSKKHFSSYYDKKTKNLVAQAYDLDFIKYNYKQ